MRLCYAGLRPLPLLTLRPVTCSGWPHGSAALQTMLWSPPPEETLLRSDRAPGTPQRSWSPVACLRPCRIAALRLSHLSLLLQLTPYGAGEQLCRTSMEAVHEAGKGRVVAAISEQWTELQNAAASCAGSRASVRKFVPAISRFLNGTAGLLTLK